MTWVIYISITSDSNNVKSDINEKICHSGISGDFPRDVFPKSKWTDIETASRISEIEMYQPINDVICNRMRFREYCMQIGLIQPNYFVADKFSKISDWLIKQNSFPKVIKFTENSSNCHNMFKLNGFREFPQFYELMTKAKQESMIVEDWVTGRALIEITVINGKPIHTAQVGLTKSLQVMHAWRMYPLSLPTKLTNQIMKIIDKLDSLLNIKDFPLRLSMVIGKDSITPISVSSGINRLEYYPEWSSEFDIPSLFSGSISEIKTKYIFRIHFFYKSLNQNLTESALKELNLKSFMKFACTNNVSIVLLRDKDIAVLQKDYSQIKAMLGSIAYSGN